MHRTLWIATTGLLLAGCSGGVGNITTASLFGGNTASDQAQTAAIPAAAAVPLAPQSTPISRAMHVGAVTARAMKCGYNFDPTKLKTAFLASETTMGTPVTEMPNLEKAYNVAFNGVNKVASTEPGFCSEKKTKEIKADLTRALAGDFTPPVVKVAAAAEEEEGFFGGLFSGGSSSESGPAHGSQEWWDKQAEKAGR